MKRGIVPGGILALSLAVALLAATASSASADVELGIWKCPPPSTPPTTTTTTVGQVQGCFGGRWFTLAHPFDFGYHLVGTSTSQVFALGVSGDTFNPRISVSGDYTQTNNCPPTLSAGAYPQIEGCLITVSFTPTGERKGPRLGTLTAGPGVRTVALRGYGEPRDSVPPDLKLSGPKRQDPQNDTIDGPGAHHLKVNVSCGDEWCRARATGRLTNVKQDKLSPGGPQDIGQGRTDYHTGPVLTRDSQRREVRKALAEGKNVEAKVTVRATDLSGNVATAKRTIKLVK
jgi:hypothetical protein